MSKGKIWLLLSGLPLPVKTVLLWVIVALYTVLQLIGWVFYVFGNLFQAMAFVIRLEMYAAKNKVRELFTIWY